jgi:DNA-binding NtrC family response regulator
MEGSRLNLLLTHTSPRTPVSGELPWYHTVARLLAPMGVRTYEASQTDRAMQLIEAHPIHLAVLDTRLSNNGMDVLHMIQQIRQRAAAQRPTPSPAPAVRQITVQHSADGSTKVQVSIQAQAPKSTTDNCPAVILLTPKNDQATLKQAMAMNAFSVVQEPIDLTLMLDLMARVVRRFHHNQWPQ